MLINRLYPSGITRFVLRQLWWRVASLYGLLLGVFLSVHYLLTLRSLPACILTPRVVLLLVPRLSVFAFPLALVMGIGLFIDWLYLTDQYLLFISLSSLQRQWWRLLSIVSLSAGLIYFIICGWLSPHCYRRAKQEMIAQTTTLLEKMPPGQLHAFGGQCHICWERLTKEHGLSLLHRVRLIVSRPGTKVQLVSAWVAELHDSGLQLRNGSIEQLANTSISRLKKKRETIVHHTFASLWLSYDWSGVRGDGDGAKHVPPRLQTLPEVWRGTDRASRHEVGLRIASGVWLWWLPFFLAALLPRGGRRRGSATWAVGGLATGLFCLLYVMATVTGVVCQHSLLYGTMLLLLPVALGAVSALLRCQNV